jgi:hypothetical protein
MSRVKIRLQIALALAAFALTAGYAGAESSQKLSHGQLKKMIQSAHTADDYASLASYFRWRQEELKEQARAELVKWDWPSQFAGSMTAKYPRPADAERNYYENLRYQAQQMSQKAAYYENLSEKAPQ